jgi:hypothetical protein
MESFLLILLTLDARTGGLVRSDVVGSPYTSMVECMDAAIKQGPQKATGPVAKMLVCRAADDAFTHDLRGPPVQARRATPTDPARATIHPSDLAGPGLEYASRYFGNISRRYREIFPKACRSESHWSSESLSS